MKQTLMTLLIIGLLSFVAACGNNNQENLGNIDDTNEPPEETPVENHVVHDEESEQTEAQEVHDGNMEALGYDDIEVEIEYENNVEFEFNMEHATEAKLENDLTNERLTGQEAFDFLYPILESLELNSELQDQAVIDSILSAFDLPTDYVKFEMEIDFLDGIKKEIEHRS